MWLYAIWLLLSWTRTTEQLVYGALFSVAVGAFLIRLGPSIRPWLVFTPRRLRALGGLAVEYSRRMVAANVGLARRVWAPSRPLRSGMLVVPNRVEGDAALAVLGIVTSTIVDNQIVDVSSDGRELQYHAVWITTTDPDQAAARINGSVAERLQLLAGHTGKEVAS